MIFIFISFHFMHVLCVFLTQLDIRIKCTPLKHEPLRFAVCAEIIRGDDRPWNRFV